MRGSERPWLTHLMATRPIKVAAVAFANNGWPKSMMVRGERCKEPTLLIAACSTSFFQRRLENSTVQFYTDFRNTNEHRDSERPLRGECHKDCWY
jgi:hypothetical protein